MIQASHSCFASVAPSGPPIDVKIVAENDARFAISWNQPHPHHRNGIITGYKLCIADAQSNEECDRIIITKGNGVRVSNLVAATKYKVKILARTDAGFGNYSNDIFQITNAGKTKMICCL